MQCNSHQTNYQNNKKISTCSTLRYAQQQDRHNPAISGDAKRKAADAANSTSPPSVKANAADDNPLNTIQMDLPEDSLLQIDHERTQRAMSKLINHNASISKTIRDDEDDHRSAPTILSIETLQTTDLFASDSKRHDRDVVILSDDEDRDL